VARPKQPVHQSVVRSPPAGFVEVQLAAVSEIACGCPLLQRNAFQSALREVDQPLEHNLAKLVVGSAFTSSANPGR